MNKEMEENKIDLINALILNFILLNVIEFRMIINI